MTKREFKSQEEWLEWRYDGICASDIPIIMGVSNYATAEELFESKVRRMPIKAKSKASERAMEESLALEGFVLDAAVKEPHSRQVYLEHPDIPWARCSLDALSEDGMHIFEVKCLAKTSALWNNICPIEYLHQLLWQMFVCTKAETITYIEYNKKLEKLVHDVCVDRGSLLGAINMTSIYEECERFREAVLAKDFSIFMNTQEPIAPEIQRLHGRNDLVEEFMKAKKELEIAQRAYKQAQEALLSGLDSRVSYQHDKCSIKRTPIRGRIRYEGIPVLASINLERFRGPHDMRTTIEDVPFENMV